MYYRRITEGLNDKGLLVPVGEEYDHVKDPNKDYYMSMYYYNAEQFKQFKETGTVSGIVDVVTPYITFDLDNESDIELARKDAIELVSKLITKGFTEDQITICFSGKKGFSVEILTNTLFTPAEFKNITKALAEGLTTRDEKIVNPSRVLRVPLTKHPDTGLFKLPITMTQLCEMPSEAIKAMAKSTDNAAEWYVEEVVVPESISQLKDLAPKAAQIKLSEDLSELDYSQKPKDMPACKYSILNGFFKKGHRNDCLTALAAHFKSRGFPKNITNGILVEAANLQAQRHPEDMPVSEAEIWNTVIQSVYGPNWQGKTYSCKNHSWLKELCPNNHYGCEHSYGKNKEVITIDAVSSIFKKYAEEIEKNTIPTGIKEIDDNVRLQTKSHVVLAGSSGVGKTTIIQSILRNCSERGQVALFGSMDQSDAITYQKLAQSVTGLSDKKLFDKYKQEPSFRTLVDKEIADKYKNVLFDFSSGVTIDELYERLYKAKIEYGSDLRLAVYDYINLISGPYSDANANLAYVAPKLKDLANELDLLIISLAQIARDKGGPSTPLKDHRIAKGSSAIEESATVLLGMWRPYYNTDNDNYITIAALKNRLGREFKKELYWNGLTGEIRGLTPEEAATLEDLKEHAEFNDESDSFSKVKLQYKNRF